MTNSIPLHVVAVTAFIKKGNKYLLARRSQNDDQAPGEWSIPGGKVEMDLGAKVIEETLKKEIMEEVGITIKDGIELIYNDAFIRSSGDHVIMLTFRCEWEAGEAKPLEDQEEVLWLTYEEMLNMENLPVYIKKRIKSLNS